MKTKIYYNSKKEKTIIDPYDITKSLFEIEENDFIKRTKNEVSKKIKIVSSTLRMWKNSENVINNVEYNYLSSLGFLSWYIAIYWKNDYNNSLYRFFTDLIKEFPYLRNASLKEHIEFYINEIKNSEKEKNKDLENILNKSEDFLELSKEENEKKLFDFVFWENWLKNLLKDYYLNAKKYWDFYLIVRQLLEMTIAEYFQKQIVKNLSQNKEFTKEKIKENDNFYKDLKKEIFSENDTFRVNIHPDVIVTNIRERIDIIIWERNEENPNLTEIKDHFKNLIAEVIYTLDSGTKKDKNDLIKTVAKLKKNKDSKISSFWIFIQDFIDNSKKQDEEKKYEVNDVE